MLMKGAGVPADAASPPAGIRRGSLIEVKGCGRTRRERDDLRLVTVCGPKAAPAPSEILEIADRMLRNLSQP